MPNPIFPIRIDCVRCYSRALKKNDFVTLKESHVVEIVLTAAARVKHSVRAPFSICLMLSSFSPSKMTFTENCFLRGDLTIDYLLEWRRSLDCELYSVLSESWWISRHCPLWCAHVIYAFLSPTQLSSALGIWMSSTDEYKSEYTFLSETRSPLFSSVRYDGTTTLIIISHLE